MSGYASTGSLWKDKAPQAISRTAIAMTTNRLLSAKSTSLRIICCPVWGVSRSLVDRALEDQRVLHELFARLDPRLDLLQVAGHEVSGDDFHAPKRPIGRRHVDPVAIVQVQDRRGRDDGARLRALAPECGRGEHAQAHDSRIGYLDANLCCAEIRIEDRSDVADLAGEGLFGLRVEAEPGDVADSYAAQAILIDI